MRTILALDSEAGIISVGSPPTKLPGILESLTVSGKLLFENVEVEGRSGSVKIAHGWEDSTVAIELLLIDDTERKKSRFDCLKDITSIFKRVLDDGKPSVYVLHHKAIEAWQVREVLFSDLKSVEKRGRQQITVSLSFVEYDPLVATMQKRQSGGKKNEQAAAPASPVIPDKTRRGLGKVEAKFE